MTLTSDDPPLPRKESPNQATEELMTGDSDDP
jgi:hypothetical protein